MNIDKKLFTSIQYKITNLLKRYFVLIFILLGLGIFGYLVFRINTLSNKEPSDDLINQKLGQKQSIHINESDVNKVKELQSNNVEVQSLFNQTRNNPFQE